MRSELDAGQLWVNAKIRELTESKKIHIQAFDWENPFKRSDEHVMQRSLGLVVWLGAERRFLRFMEEELANVDKNTGVQSVLSQRLEYALR
jgi:predicted lactoylglutathione lyase